MPLNPNIFTGPRSVLLPTSSRCERFISPTLYVQHDPPCRSQLTLHRILGTRLLQFGTRCQTRTRARYSCSTHDFLVMIVTVIFTQIKVLHAYCMLHAQHTAQITQLVFVYVDSSFFCLARYHFLLQYINSFRDGASHNRSGTAYSSHSHGPQE